MGHRCAIFGGALAVAGALIVASVPLAGQAPAGSAAPGPAPTTSWGDPDLQGIWMHEYQTPLQRPPLYADKEFFTEEERAALDKRRAAIQGRDQRGKRGTEEDVAGAYNAVFQSVRRTGRRTSLVVDPPNGRVPQSTPAVQKRAAEVRAYQLAILQATDTCKNQEPECRGGTYGPPSPRRNEPFPYYNMSSSMSPYMNRHDHPEDSTFSERCLSGGVPDFIGIRRIVQSPDSIAILQEGGTVHRVVPITTRAHLPSKLQQWWGDSRARWEGKTLVVDVSNFSWKQDFGGSRETLHVVERYTLLDANTLEYAVTLQDPTTWTRSWTVKAELTRQSTKANRIYPEPRCHEGNYGLAGQLTGSRADEKAFAEGRGPDPATRDTSGRGVGTDDNQDPLNCGPQASRCDAGDPETFKNVKPVK